MGLYYHGLKNAPEELGRPVCVSLVRLGKAGSLKGKKPRIRFERYVPVFAYKTR